MKKKRCLKGCLNKNQSAVTLNLIQGLPRLSWLLALRNNMRGRFQIKFGMTSLFNNGFTLIELLVVVLIIGILAAVAVPQYQKAVVKSRAAQLMTAASVVGRDAMAYQMATGEAPTEFAQLSLDYDLPTKRTTRGVCGNAIASTDAQRENDTYQIVLNNLDGNYHGINTAFVTGPYKCTGFAYVLEENKLNLNPGELYCVELSQTASAWTAFSPAGGFCEKVMKGTYIGDNSWRFYKLP